MTFDDDYKKAFKAWSEHFKNYNLPEEDYERFYKDPISNPGWDAFKAALQEEIKIEGIKARGNIIEIPDD